MTNSRRRGGSVDKSTLDDLSNPGAGRLVKAQSSDVVNELAGSRESNLAGRVPTPSETSVAPRPAKTGSAKKSNFYQLEGDANRMRAAYINTQAQTHYTSLSEFINAAVNEKVAALEAEYNAGQPWPPIAPRGIPTGRPMQH